ncbi:hypothetical protein NB501_07805 [Vibrio alginolyticus]|uniref:hypothetical protein n=1 Tax=Vibrio alginolyticus TaxID=663 RepID=UPI001B80F127|nr:hypothetical protein [Vibrio alginolyticus]MCR9575354.1 hypothetical protein [Vibrio alginolyticus]HBC3974086.1 hypothetical protein [Vibrio alginolyticus]
MSAAPETSVTFDWLPAALEQLNVLHEKAPMVVNTCLLMLCAAPLVAALSLPLFAIRKKQNDTVLEAFRNNASTSAQSGR